MDETNSQGREREEKLTFVDLFVHPHPNFLLEKGILFRVLACGDGLRSRGRGIREGEEEAWSEKTEIELRVEQSAELAHRSASQLQTPSSQSLQKQRTHTSPNQRVG